MRRFPIYLIPVLILWLAALFAACAPPPPDGGIATGDTGEAETISADDDLELIGCTGRTCVYEVGRTLKGDCVIAIYRPFSGDDVIDLECPTP